jgi:hypothetical protein
MSNSNMFPSKFTNSTSILECPGSGDGHNFYITAASNAGNVATATIYNTTSWTGTAFGVATALQTTDSFKIPSGSLSLPGIGIPAKGVKLDSADCYLFYYTR